MTTRRHLAALLLLACSSLAAAQTESGRCDGATFEAVARHLGIQKLTSLQDGGPVVSAVCKTWPYNPDLLLTAIAYDAGVEYEKQLLIAVIDKRTGLPKHLLRQALLEDAVAAVGEHSLKLDTARYQLADNVRAFGVRFVSANRGPNCGTAYSDDELSLLVPDGHALRRVLRMDMRQQRWLKGCPSAAEDAHWEDAQLSIGIAKTSTHGFRDIVVSAKISVNATGQATAAIHGDRVEHQTLRYDGKAYPTGSTQPWWLAH